MHAKPVGRGYVILESNADHPWRARGATHAGAELHGHEFHYSDIANLPAGTRYAYAMRRGHGVDGKHDGILLHRMLASYSHLRATAGCDWPAKFVQYVRNCKNPDFKEVPACSL
jgi:cobyrinic acid a,c-diamide synthase